MTTPPPPSGTDFTPGIIITVLVLAIAVILSASFYLLLRLLRRHRHRHHSSSSASASVHHHHHRPNARQVSPAEKNPLIEALPLFSFDSLSRGAANTSADCAVCLSKFEPKDLLRLLPICCHAFHAECIDTWLAGNQTCPLCRSPIFLSESEILGKFSLPRQNSLSSSSITSGSRSFRVEIGNVSRRGVPNSGEIRRSLSIGDSFDYVLDDAVSEVPAGSFRMPAEFKVEPTAPPVEEYGALAAEVGPRGGWLKDYLSYSVSSSGTTSFRGSGRWFFTGSSRRSTTELPPSREPELDLEASQLSNEIGELFRWLSGV